MLRWLKSLFFSLEHYQIELDMFIELDTVNVFAKIILTLSLALVLLVCKMLCEDKI